MDLLQTRNQQIVDGQGQPIRLRGTCIGGWMNMENFINGFPGVEHELRLALAEVLGPSKAHFFFERWLDYFLAEDDIALIKACDANVVRLALNYRHFEHDARPFRYNEAGFERLARAVQWCAKHGLYVILDLHAVQGWQNPDWHSDNATQRALFWEHLHFQDRYVALWEELARRYQGNPTIAGYDLMNEPLTRLGEHDWAAINRVYRRVVQAIRAIDPDHIIFVEGDGFAGHFDGLDAPFADHLVYSTHAYHPASSGHGPYPGVVDGEYWDREKLRTAFLNRQSTRYIERYQVPLWIGEFGAVSSGPDDRRTDRLRALSDQLDIFEEFGAHWTTWTHKDVGVMGWVQLDPNSDYLQLVGPVLQAKDALHTDTWMTWLPPSPATEALDAAARLVDRTIGDLSPVASAARRSMIQAAQANTCGRLLQPAYAERFRGMTEADLDRVLQSFALKQCIPNHGLINLIKEYIDRPE